MLLGGSDSPANLPHTLPLPPSAGLLTKFVQEKVVAIRKVTAIFFPDIGKSPALVTVVEVHQKLDLKPLGIVSAFAHLAEAFECS